MVVSLDDLRRRVVESVGSSEVIKGGYGRRSGESHEVTVARQMADGCLTSVLSGGFSVRR